MQNSEERILYFATCRVRLVYDTDGRIDMLRFEHQDGQQLVVTGHDNGTLTSVIAPEHIYESLRQCNVEW